MPPQQRKLQKFEPPPPPDLSAGLPLMMYGHGDSNMPLSESVDLVNALLTQHIRELTLRALRTNERRDARGKFETNDVCFMLRKNHTEVKRLNDMQRFQQDLKQLQQMKFDESDEVPIYDMNRKEEEED
eukprot:6729-Heterococcus_DN1.PRE.3